MSRDALDVAAINVRDHRLDDRIALFQSDVFDAVPPADKERARGLVVEALNGLDWGTKTRAVRINSTDTPWCHEDVLTVVSSAKPRAGLAESLELMIATAARPIPTIATAAKANRPRRTVIVR